MARDTQPAITDAEAMPSSVKLRSGKLLDSLRLFIWFLAARAYHAEASAAALAVIPKFIN
jgi:hypothetical protein